MDIHTLVSIVFVTAAIVLTCYVVWDIRHGEAEKRAERLKQRAHELGRDDLLKN
jgi:hypothetical protein